MTAGLPENTHGELGVLLIRETMLRVAMAIVALAAGCYHSPGLAVYGPAPPSQPPDPDLRITGFSYEPAPPVAVGAEITFTVTLNKPHPYGMVRVRVVEDDPRIGPEAQQCLWIGVADSGNPPDAVDGDGVYTGSWQVPAVLGGLDSLPVVAKVEWWSTAPAPERHGTPLTVMAPEEAE